MEHDHGDTQALSPIPSQYLGGDQDGAAAYAATYEAAPATDNAGVLQAMESLEEVHRSMPHEFSTLGALQHLSPEARQAVVALLSLPAPGRDAVRQMLTLPHELRLLIAGVARLPADVQSTLRALLA
jgi:hypothetical protein